ncbi:BPSL0761 family protein [Pseudomonas nicosulfuronedens]
MTTPSERSRAVLQARELLAALANNPELDESVRESAQGVLRHFPTPSEMHQAGLIEESSRFGAIFESTDRASRYGWPVTEWGFAKRCVCRLTRLLIRFLASGPVKRAEALDR